MLTDEERERLEIDRASAKHRCGLVYSTICQLKAMLRSYQSEHNRWRRKFEAADRALAEEHKKIIPIGGEKKKKQSISVDDVNLLVKLDRAQILRIAEELGVDFETDD